MTKTPAARREPEIVVTSTPTFGKSVLSRQKEGGNSEQSLLLGIDLGTSRSSIVSMHGVRKTIESYVGWPKDAVSRKHLNADIVFGDLALKNRLALDLYRPLEKGVIKFTDSQEESADVYHKNMEAAKMLLHHLVSLSEPGCDEMTYGVIGVPAQATVKNNQAIIEAAKDVLDHVMIVSEPFSVAYGLDRISDVLVVDIGAGTTDLCRMHGTVPLPEDQISLEIAGDAIDQHLYDQIRSRYPEAQMTINMCREFKERYGFVSDAKDKIEVLMPVQGKPMMHDITQELREACSRIVKPIVDSIHKLVSTFDPEFQEKLRHNVILSGGGSQLNGLVKAVTDGMDAIGGGDVIQVDEPLYAGANGSLKLAMDMPAEYWRKLQGAKKGDKQTAEAR